MYIYIYIYICVCIHVYLSIFIYTFFFIFIYIYTVSLFLSHSLDLCFFPVPISLFPAGTCCTRSRATRGYTGACTSSRPTEMTCMRLYISEISISHCLSLSIFFSFQGAVLSSMEESRPLVDCRNMLHSFGGNSGMYGRMHVISSEPVIAHQEVGPLATTLCDWPPLSLGPPLSVALSHPPQPRTQLYLAPHMMRDVDICCTRYRYMLHSFGGNSGMFGRMHVTSSDPVIAH